MTENKPTHVEEKTKETTRNIELQGDDSTAGTQAPQEEKANNIDHAPKPEEKSED